MLISHIEKGRSKRWPRGAGCRCRVKNLKDTIIQPLINIIPFSFIKRIGFGKLIIPYYHVVSDEAVPHISHLYKHKRTRQFIDDLEFLLKHYSPIGLWDLIGWVRGKNNPPPNCFLLTFDDGFREIYDVIAPILSDKGIPATFFINSEAGGVFIIKS